MFSGNSRFKLLRRLGAGSMGVVYEALDQQRNTRVALKTLREVDANLLYRLKREFRSLRDLSHRNLIGLDELFEENGHWFFTMELLDGEDLDAHFGRIAATTTTGNLVARQALGSDTLATMEAPLGVGPSLPTWAGSLAPRPEPQHWAPVLDFDRVREVLSQITEGLIAIHDAGKIHRDIKPSNIIVTRDGRTVILDFGLVTEQWGAARSGEGEVVGTVVYMAPEQAAAQALGPSADWYSLGVILYEVITGQKLFDGSWLVVLAAKQHTEPRNPRELNPACPEDLAELCVRLLQIDPQHRPHGAEILARLAAGKRTSPVRRPLGSTQRRVFVGRDDELRALRQALDDVGAGAAITVFVHGESGIGKTTLLQHFVRSVEAESDTAVILTGQCREHEAVPFQAMDGIIDALSRYVCRLSDVAAAELVPKNAALLPSVFPVLGRIAAIAKAPRPVHVASDPYQQRKRIFTALREMLCLLAERYRLIWVIDDLQWVDSDSLHLLIELLQPPEQPQMLLLASVRTENGSLALPPLPGELRSLHVQPLDARESTALAGMLLDRLAPEHRPQTARIVDETGGHPLFIGELVRYAAADGDAEPRQLRLDEAIWARVAQLEPAALAVLKIACLAVAPLSEDILRAATRLDARGFQRAIAILRAGHLVRSASPSHAVLDVYHDRVRQSVVVHIDGDERIALHEQIAFALETSAGHVAPELLIRHLQGAQQLDNAGHKALEAAERALAGLAFDQAIQLYETALALAAWSEAEQRAILIKLGGALASVGRGPQAATAYARAADGADPITQLSCRILEAEQLVQSGHLERGATLLFSLFREHGHELPGSQNQMILRIAWYRVRLAVRGLRWTDRHRSEIQPRDLAVLTLYKAAGRGLILVDPVRAAYFVIRGLLLAMATGDRDSVMYFLMLEAGFRGGEGGERHAGFLNTADDLMQRHDDALFQIVYRLNLGARAHLAIDRQFKETLDLLERSDEAHGQTAHIAWEISAARFFLISNLHKMGDFARLRIYADRFRREAEQRGNIYARTTISRLCNLLWLVDDDPAGARADLKADSWAFNQGYHLQHWQELNALVDISIYEGSPFDQAVFAEHLKAIKKSSLQRVLGYSCDTAWMVGRVALAEATRDPAQRRTVRRSIAKLLGYDTHYTRMLGHMLRATLAVHEGDLAAAANDFRAAIAAGEQADIAFVPAAARRRLGAILGGDDGRQLVASAEQWMRAAGIKDPDRMTNLASPCTVPS